MKKISFLFLISIMLLNSCNTDEQTDSNDQTESFSCGRNIQVSTQDEVDFLASQGCDFIPSLTIGDITNTNSDIIDLSGLSNLTGVGSLVIANNNALTSLQGLNNITDVDLLWVRENNALTSLEGLNALTESQGNIQIFNNDNLTSIEGLNSLEIVINGIDISNNDALLNLDGLESFTDAYGGIRISNNNILQNIDGLINLRIIDEGVAPNQNTLPMPDDLSISANYALNDFCGITTLIQANNDPDIFGGISGQYNVGGNAYNPTQSDILSGNCNN